MSKGYREYNKWQKVLDLEMLYPSWGIQWVAVEFRHVLGAEEIQIQGMVLRNRVLRSASVWVKGKGRGKLNTLNNPYTCTWPHTHTRTLTHSHVNLWSFPFSSAGAIIPRPFLSSQPLCPSLFLLLRLLLGCFLCLALFTVSSLQLRYVQDARLVYVCVWKREGPQRIKRDGGKKEIGIRGSLA